MSKSGKSSLGDLDRDNISGDVRRDDLEPVSRFCGVVDRVDSVLVSDQPQVKRGDPINSPSQGSLTGSFDPVNGRSRSYLLDLVVDDMDENNEMVSASRNKRHLRLLAEGWYPTRWKHPECGDLEMVVSDKLWVSHRGPIIGPDAAVSAMLADGRNRFVRDTDGNLIAVGDDTSNRSDGTT